MNKPYDREEDEGFTHKERVGRENLEHALADNCTDPDCEIHNPYVGLGEETIGLTELAFFVAGYLSGAAAMGDQYDSVKGNLQDEVAQEVDRKEKGYA